MRKNLGCTRIRTQGAARWEARMFPQYYAVPPDILIFNPLSFRVLKGSLSLKDSDFNVDSGPAALLKHVPLGVATTSHTFNIQN